MIWACATYRFFVWVVLVLWRFLRVVLGRIDCGLWVFIVFDWWLMWFAWWTWLAGSYWFSILRFVCLSLVLIVVVLVLVRLRVLVI